MTNFQLVSAITRSNWFMHPDHVAGYLPIINALFENNDFSEQKAETPFYMSEDSGNAWNHSTRNEPQPNSVAVIPVTGPMFKYDQECGPRGTMTIAQYIAKADAHPNVKAIVLKLDSPGGQADGTLELAELVRNASKPVVGFISDMTGSAAYWVASACSHIVANNGNAIVGSIGAMSSFIDFREQLKTLGIKQIIVNADQSPDKNAIFQDVLDGDTKEFKEEFLNPLAQSFIDTVMQNRPSVLKEQTTGKVYRAENVVGSLVDEIASFDEAIQIAFNLNKPSKKTVYVR